MIEYYPAMKKDDSVTKQMSSLKLSSLAIAANVSLNTNSKKGDASHSYKSKSVSIGVYNNNHRLNTTNRNECSTEKHSSSHHMKGSHEKNDRTQNPSDRHTYSAEKRNKRLVEKSNKGGQDQKSHEIKNSGSESITERCSHITKDTSRINTKSSSMIETMKKNNGDVNDRYSGNGRVLRMDASRRLIGHALGIKIPKEK